VEKRKEQEGDGSRGKRGGLKRSVGRGEEKTKTSPFAFRKQKEKRRSGALEREIPGRRGLKSRTVSCFNPLDRNGSISGRD